MRLVFAIMLAAMLPGALTACVQDTAAPHPEVTSEPPLPIRSRMEADRDDALKAIVRRKLTESDRAAFRAITIEVWQQRLMLMGAVAKPEHRRRAEAIARSQSGVTEVFNEVLLAEEAAFPQFTPDPDAEQQIRLALGIQGLTDGFAVRVVNQVAYLLGRVSSPAEIERLKAEATGLDGIKWAVARLY